MGIDYYSCSECGKGFPDVMSYAWCQSCGSKLCESCMNEYGVGHGMADAKMIQDTLEDGEAIYDLCPFCSDEIITDEVLLSHAIFLLDTTREDLEEHYRADA